MIENSQWLEMQDNLRELIERLTKIICLFISKYELLKNTKVVFECLRYWLESLKWARTYFHTKVSPSSVKWAALTSKQRELVSLVSRIKKSQKFRLCGPQNSKIMRIVEPTCCITLHLWKKPYKCSKYFNNGILGKWVHFDYQ